MKYKAIFYNSASTSDVDVAGNFSFYTKGAAETACSAWVESGTTRHALLWNGTGWQLFTQ